MSVGLFKAVFCLFAAMSVMVYVVAYVLNVAHNRAYRVTWYIPLLLVIALRCAAESAFWFVNDSDPAQSLVLGLATATFILGNGIYQAFLHFVAEGFSFPEKRRLLRFTDIVFALVALALILLASTGLLYNYVDGSYVHGPLYNALVVLISLTAAITLALLLVKGRAIRIQVVSIVSFALLPIMGNALTTVLPFLPWFVAGCLLALQIFQATLYSDEVIRGIGKEALAAEQKAELDRHKNLLMVSQIQPHFLYNTLGAIACLCDEQPKQAKDLTLRFSRYLRHNIKSLSEEGLVPFREELNHAREYLSIEQVRFQDRLQVVFAIEDEDFMLPTLVLQPLVENAVKHGIGPKPEGGTVSVSSRCRDGYAVVTVQDDGVGFGGDALGRPAEGGHFGLRNIQERLALTCGGILAYQSAFGEGTTVTVSIPLSGKERA